MLGNRLFQQILMPQGNKAYTLLLLVTLASASLYFFGAICNVLGLGKINDSLQYILPPIFAILSISIFKQSVKGKDVLIYILFIAFVFLSPSIYPKSEKFIESDGIKFAFAILPYYFLGLSINYERNKSQLYWVARIGVVLQMLWQLLCLAGVVNTYNNNEDLAREQMVFAYGFLFPAMFVSHIAFTDHTLVDIILTFVSILILFIMGTRGPIVIYLVYVLGMAIVFNKYNTMNLVKKISMIIAFSMLYYFLNPILLAASVYASSFGLSTRVFDSILDNEMLNMDESSGRDDITNVLLQAIRNDNTGFGYGLGTDRYFTLGSYAHNFETEILVEFGSFGGGLILLGLGIFLIMAFFKVKGSSASSFLFLMFCYGIVGMQFSGSWLAWPAFFILMGYCVSVLRDKNFENNIQTQS